MEKYIVERISGDEAILEKDDLSYLKTNIAEFGFDISEGDCLFFDGEVFRKDEQLREERKDKLLSLQEKLLKRSKK